MGFFNFGGKAKESINKFNGNKDFLEAICAGCALVAAADGSISDAEAKAALTAMQSNKMISAAFGAREIELCFGKMESKVTTRSGRAELKKEIDECIARDKTGSMGEAVLYACLDVADDGGIDAAEEKVLREIAGLLRVDYDKLAA